MPSVTYRGALPGVKTFDDDLHEGLSRRWQRYRGGEAARNTILLLFHQGHAILQDSTGLDNIASVSPLSCNHTRNDQ
jgi:hypothetical protein